MHCTAMVLKEDRRPSFGIDEDHYEPGGHAQETLNLGVAFGQRQTPIYITFSLCTLTQTNYVFKSDFHTGENSLENTGKVGNHIQHQEKLEVLVQKRWKFSIC